MASINMSIKEITVTAPTTLQITPSRIRVIKNGVKRPLTANSQVSENTKVTSKLVKLKPRVIKINPLQDI